MSIARKGLVLLGMGAFGCVQVLGLERAEVDPTLEEPLQEAEPVNEFPRGPTCQHFDNDQRLGARGGRSSLAPLPPAEAPPAEEGPVQ